MLTPSGKGACECAGPTKNVTVDGNAGHSPSCPANPNTWPEGLRVCDGCGIPFEEPVSLEYALTIFGDLSDAAFICDGCDESPLTDVLQWVSNA